jgi:hypothetical protein
MDTLPKNLKKLEPDKMAEKLEYSKAEADQSTLQMDTRIFNSKSSMLTPNKHHNQFPEGVYDHM